MEIAKKEKDGIIIVSFMGRLDAASAGDTEAELNGLISKGVKLLVDLSKLEYISSAGLRVLLVAAKQIRSNNGKMCLCELNESVNDELLVLHHHQYL